MTPGAATVGGISVPVSSVNICSVLSTHLHVANHFSDNDNDRKSATPADWFGTLCSRVAVKGCII